MLVQEKALALVFWQRHRMGLIVVTSAVVLTAILVRIALSTQDNQLVAIGAWLNFSATLTGLLYIVSVFAFGFETNVNHSGSCYPRHFLTLPVSTAALAYVPVVLAASLLSLYFLLFAQLLLQSETVPWHVVLLWPNLLIINMVLMIQILFWWPLRVMARFIAWGLFGHLPLTGFLALTGIVIFDFSWYWLIPTAFLAVCLIVESWLVYVAVARARSGRITVWQLPLISWWRKISWSAGEKLPFRTPFAAQLWYETKKLMPFPPLIAGWTCLFSLWMLFSESTRPNYYFNVVAVALLVPVFMGCLAVNIAGEGKRNSTDYFGLGSYISSRPLPVATILAAKFMSSIRIIMMMWVIVLIEIALAVYLSNTEWKIGRMVVAILGEQSTSSLWAIFAGGLLMLVLFSFKQSIDVLLSGLSGRIEVINTVIMSKMLILALAMIAVMWATGTTDPFSKYFPYLIVILPMLVAVKLLSGTLIIARVLRKKLLAPQTVGIAVAIWLAIVVTASAVLLWGIPSDLVPSILLVLVIILMTPFARLAATPLAMEWSRHR